MDAITLLQIAASLIAGIIFMTLSIMDIRDMIEQHAKSVLAPIWCILTGICWFAFGIVSLYATTVDYLSALSYIWFGVGFMFLPILFIYAAFLNINLSGQENKAKEMRLE